MTIYAFFHSFINSGIIVWGRACNKNITVLQKIQTRILKLISKNHCLQNILLNVSQLFTVEIRYIYHLTEISNEDFVEIYKKSKYMTRNKCTNK